MEVEQLHTMIIVTINNMLLNTLTLDTTNTAQVQHLRTINRRRQCPTATDHIEDALLFDCMWSDPWDFPGVAKAAHRGANCIRFGPDVSS